MWYFIFSLSYRRAASGGVVLALIPFKNYYIPKYIFYASHAIKLSFVYLSLRRQISKSHKISLI